MSDFQRVRTWLAGNYSNRTQAMAEPVWFIPVTLWYVEVAGLFGEGAGFFTEQVSEHTPNQPYRSRVLQLLDNPLRLENYRLKDQKVWAGAAKDPGRLGRLRADDCEQLAGCTIYLERQGETFTGKMQPGGGCRLFPGDASYIEIEFELGERSFFTLDRGFDATTGEQTWGSRAGAYRYLKQLVE
ncbi:chromophore lyase CpcT/CpeT [Gloeobacter morelensis MG652769]|uniref:Chromophore lyase CpcT/CpeT n=1 Tax=Gloeobacter morelensis MG652769 TaxID=2781736 RepID=A0ABY3PT43_9CYAN|nr:chromophore lyase CpcT/CpeT [Gloeobacter morelensis MG652769]